MTGISLSSPRRKTAPGAWAVVNTDMVGRRLTWAGTAIFAALHSAWIVSRYERFRVFAFDFGIFDQGLWLLSRFETPFVTIRGLNLFADHSSYVMVLLTPLYWAWSDPRVLLVATVVFLAAAGPLLYAIGRSIGVEPGLAMLLALAYLVHPAMRWATWDNFHPEFLTVPLLMGATLLLLQDRSGWAIGLTIVALSAKEDAGLVVIPLGIWAAWGLRKRMAGMMMAALGGAAMVVNFLVLLPALSPTGRPLYTGRYAEYGTSVLGIVAGAITKPGQLFGDLWNLDTFAYVGQMLLAAPTSVLSPALLIGAPVTLTNAMSSFEPQIQIRYHYTAYLLFAVGIASVFGARRLQRSAGRSQFVAGLVLMAALIGLLPGPGPRVWRSQDDVPAFRAAIAYIGPGDVVSAESRIAAHLAQRTDVFRFPNPFRRLDYGAPGTPYELAVDDVEWVIVARNHMPPFGEDVLADLAASPEWSIVVDNPEVVLLRRSGGG